MHSVIEYSRQGTALTRVDARVKIVVALVVLMMILTCEGVIFPLFVALVCLFQSIRLGITLRTLVLRFSEPMFIAAIVLLLTIFFHGKEALFSTEIMGLTVIGYKDGLLHGLQIAGRILGAVSLVALLVFATPFSEILAGLSWFRVPKGFIEILMFAYRSIFVLFEDAQVIYQAQKNRLGYSSVRRGLSSFGTLAGSLTIRAFDNSQSTTVAMVQRGYDGSVPMLMHKSFKVSEVMFSALILFVTGAVWKIV